MRRIMFFISSYIPLYILLIIKNVLERCTDGGRFAFSLTKLRAAHFFDEVNDFAIIALLVLCVISFWYLKSISKKNGDTHYYEVVKVKDKTGNVYFNYISIYLLSCLGLTLNSIVDVFILLFLMVIVGYIYISNRMTYMNPVLQFLGYKIYECKVISKSTGEKLSSIIIADRKMAIESHETYSGSGKEDFIFVSGKGNSDDKCI